MKFFNMSSSVIGIAWTFVLLWGTILHHLLPLTNRQVNRHHQLNNNRMVLRDHLERILRIVRRHRKERRRERVGLVCLEGRILIVDERGAPP